MKTPYSTTTIPAGRSAGTARFLLLGDSHAGPVGRAAEAADVPFQGGPIGAGREFNEEFFDPRGGDVVFRDQDAERLYRGFLGALAVDGLGGIGVPLVSTFGLSAHTLATTEYWRIYRDARGAFATGFLTSDLFADIVRTMVRGALAFYTHALGLGLRVLAVMPPQRVPGMSDPDVFLAAQETVRDALDRLGVEIVDLCSRVTDARGFQRPAFCETDDTIHGNLAFGRLILSDLLDRGL